MIKRRTTWLVIVALLFCALSCNRSNDLSVEPLINPALPGSIAPNMTQASNGQIILSWLEPAGNGLALRFASRTAQGWSAAQTIVAGKNFGKYAEAPPWVLMLPCGSLVAVWAEELPTTDKWPGNYLYTASSRDQGKTWSQPTMFIPTGRAALNTALLPWLFWMIVTPTSSGLMRVTTCQNTSTA